MTSSPSSSHEPFFLALQNRQFDEAMKLLAADPTIAQGRTPLLYGGHLGGQPETCTHSALTAATTEGHFPLVQALVERGASLEETGLFGETPLHDACWYGHLEVAHYLIDQGASLEATDGEFEATPIIWAVHGCGTASWAGLHHQAEIAQLLKDRGAQIPKQWILDIWRDFGPLKEPMEAKLIEWGLEKPVGEEGL